MTDAEKDIIRRLLSFQWLNRGYGSVQCSSCGALGSVDYDEYGSPIRQEPCSKTCPWRLAAEAIQ